MNRLCVVFDIDDTLYLERDYVASGFAAVSAWAQTWLGVPDFAHHCESAPQGRVFNTALESAGLKSTPELVAALVSIYRTHVPAIHLLDDALQALEEITVLYPVAVITDGPAVSQSRKAEALGLARFASPILLTEVFGKECSKPSPVVFRHVETAIPASRYVYIADNPLKDFHAPSELGWHTVRIRRPGGLHHDLDNPHAMPDYELPDCTELPRLLSSLPRKTGAVA